MSFGSWEEAQSFSHPYIDDVLINLKRLLEYHDWYLENSTSPLSKKTFISEMKELSDLLLHVISSYDELISSWIGDNMPKYQQLWDVLLAETLKSVDTILNESDKLSQDDLVAVFSAEARESLHKAVHAIFTFMDCYRMSSTFRACFYLRYLSAEEMVSGFQKFQRSINHYYSRARLIGELDISRQFHQSYSEASEQFPQYSRSRLESELPILRHLHFMESVITSAHYGTPFGTRTDHEVTEFRLSKAWKAIINHSIYSSYYSENTVIKFSSIAIYAQVSIREQRKSVETASHKIEGSLLQLLKIGPCLSSTWIEEIGVTFWDCILESLLEILQRGSFQLVQWKDQTRDLHKQLQFFKYFLTVPPVEFTENLDWNDLSKMIKVTISRQAPFLPCYYDHCVKFCEDADNDMSRTIRIVKSFERETFSHRPRTDDEFGSVDYFIEKLDIQISHSSLKNVKKPHLEKALEELTSLHASMYEICDKRNECEKMKSLCSQIGDVAYAMGYIVHSLLGETCPGSHLTQWFSDLENDTKLIKERVNAISRENISSSQEQNVTRSSNYKLSHGDDPLIDEEIVGFVEEEVKVIDLIVRGSEDNEMVLISGMPGLGKTTLAKKVYNNQIVLDHFYVRSWCCVSQGYQRKDLLVQILKHITPFKDGMDENRLAEILRKELMQRRYLIVMDDIWDSTAWDEIRMCFPDNRNGSRILLTSRFNDLPFQSTTKIHILNPLSDDESRELLRKKLLLTENSSSKLLEIGDRIAKGCKGVPLVVVLVAGLLADMNIEQWQKVACNSMSFVVNDSQRQCAHILEMSYKNLPYYLKPCFLYLGCYPPDSEISSTKLIQLWIAEGFIKRRVSNNLECIAEGYLVDLVQRNLIQVAERRSLGGIKRFRVHDLIHDFCSSKGKEKFVQRITDASGATGKHAPRLSIVYDWGNDSVDWSSYMDVRSLLFYSNNIQTESTRYIFEKFKLLRVLDLMTPHLMWDIIDLPYEIGLLVHLRFLAGPFSSIPSSIGTLNSLVTFRMVALGTDVIDLPSSFYSLVRLRHLSINSATIFKTEHSYPVSPFYSLQTLSTLLLPKFGGTVLTSFPSLRKLKCLFVNVKQRTTYPEFNLLTQLESLEMTYLLGDGDETVPLCNSNWQFSFPPSIRKLTLKMFCLPWSEMSIIDELPNLEVLNIDHSSFVGEEWNMGGVMFHKLKYLKLRGLNIIRWNASEDHFPPLEKLVIQGCKYLEGIPAEFENCYTLKMIEVSGCKFSVETSAREIHKEQVEYGNEELKILARDNDPNKAYLWSGTVRKKLASEVL